jgi:Family of unknown function (DUF6188)
MSSTRGREGGDGVKGLDSVSFAGSQVTMVKSTEHLCSIVFELPDRLGGLEISIESSGAIGVGESSQVFDAGPELARRCLDLLGSTVSAVELTSEGDLTIRFAAGDALVVRNEAGPYESYQVVLAGKVIHVA